MPHDLPKAYDPTAIEDRWAAYWVRENLFTVPTPDPTTTLVQNQGPDGKSFTILLPPPNVTGNLHMGHMFEHTESDILVRWRRMCGDRVLWVPGTDHAGIATQMLVERQVASEGTTRQKMGREAFLARVWQWKEHYGGTILEQMKRIGDTVDWHREYFTMSDHLSVAVREAFVRLYHQGLIYRGAYIVNWCPRCQTAISDLEVTHAEQKGHLWEIRYPVLGPAGDSLSDEFITVATTRPETMLGDTAVAIHPDDARYTHLHGKKLRLPLMNREIPIVLDEWVSREFGTGAVKVTPAHDPNDFALGERHHLPSINVMDERAHINSEGGPYAGLDRFAARKKIVEDLEAQGLLAAVKDHVNNVGHCARCKTVVEPRLSNQWFIAVNKQPNGGGPTIAELAVAAVKPGSGGAKPIRITPENYEKIYLEWMTNLHDWCISRQLWWGHRIPAWHCAACHKITVPLPNSTADPAACAHCGAKELTQETDVLDTWFSSGLLPVSVFGWPNIVPTTAFHPEGSSSANTSSHTAACHPERRSSVSADDRVEGSAVALRKSPGAPGPSPLGTGEGCRADFDAFYPTSLLVTGFDILFFWVARMIMFGCWFSRDIPLPDGSPRPLAESVPFREVYIHGLIRDANREKMSKTKGNVVDPIEIVKQYGTDAVRFTLASMASPGADIAFNVARTEGYRAFANKIWNAARFIFMNIDRAREAGIAIDPKQIAEPLTRVSDVSAPDERWIVSRLSATISIANNNLEEYRFDLAASAVYQFFWGDFCDWFLEIVKLRVNFNDPSEKSATESILAILISVFEAALRLLSPFMPFLTEELWHALYEGNPPSKSIARSRFPRHNGELLFYNAVWTIVVLQGFVTEVRALRKALAVPENELVRIQFYSNPETGSGTWGELANRPFLYKGLAKISEIEFVTSPLEGANARRTPNFDIAIADWQIDPSAERDRLTKEIAKLEKNIASADRQLNNPGFLAKAPNDVIDGLRKQRAENQRLLDKLHDDLDKLGGS